MQTPGINLDPRTKLVVAFFGGALVLTAPSAMSVAILYALLATLTLWTRTLKRFKRWLRLVLPMALFFGLVSAWAVNPAAGFLAGFRLLTLATVGYLFFVTTPPEDLANALIKAGLPYPAAFVLCTGLQFVPVLGRKARGILEAQQARGIPMKIGWRAVRLYPAFLTPLLVQAFQLAEELAEAMESRGFGRPERTFYKAFRLTPRDWLVMIGSALAVGLVWWGF